MTYYLNESSEIALNWLGASTNCTRMFVHEFENCNKIAYTEAKVYRGFDRTASSLPHKKKD